MNGFALRLVLMLRQRELENGLLGLNFGIARGPATFGTRSLDKNITAKLEKVNERALRFVFNEKHTSYCELLDKIGLPSLANQRLANIPPRFSK